MLTKPAKEVLEKLNEFTRYSEAKFANLDNRHIFTLLKDKSRSVDLKEYSGELTGILEMLEDEGYLVCESYYFRLTQKGIHHSYLEWQTVKEFLFRSIFTPIVVAFLTSMITWWLTK